MEVALGAQLGGFQIRSSGAPPKRRKRNACRTQCEMASSEIEVVSSDSTTQKTPSQVVVFDVFTASAYGDFQKLRKFVEEDGASVSEPNVNGYYPLQWAALNNFPDITQYIIEVFCFYLFFIFYFFLWK
ncbi:hypothetical protein FEM48_Zijuj09G0092500 [Ziziphus jujuba var. spinosa]|uniref:Uncharacterized protein n=1 Tax=Ziziphus jujuba var. spinosa TaxID=714518 RepID=A0A978US53_ZIZJJ|nr:hypothetical protein FEM48_Zijuj09G0092500 [Ziziphus jujuba var. spinosa]